jgi:hypothetical protein
MRTEVQEDGTTVTVIEKSDWKPVTTASPFASVWAGFDLAMEQDLEEAVACFNSGVEGEQARVTAWLQHFVETMEKCDCIERLRPTAVYQVITACRDAAVELTGGAS